jgi:hypothetical protein
MWKDTEVEVNERKLQKLTHLVTDKSQDLNPDLASITLGSFFHHKNSEN